MCLVYNVGQRNIPFQRWARTSCAFVSRQWCRTTQHVSALLIRENSQGWQSSQSNQSRNENVRHVLLKMPWWEKKRSAMRLREPQTKSRKGNLKIHENPHRHLLSSAEVKEGKRRLKKELRKWEINSTIQMTTSQTVLRHRHSVYFWAALIVLSTLINLCSACEP